MKSKKVKKVVVVEGLVQSVDKQPVKRQWWYVCKPYTSKLSTKKI